MQAELASLIGIHRDKIHEGGFMSEKKIVPALILCFFFGIFGAHRFYVGKIPTAIIQLLTIGGLGIWALIDFILIILREFNDGDGKKLTNYM